MKMRHVFLLSLLLSVTACGGSSDSSSGSNDVGSGSGDSASNDGDTHDAGSDVGSTNGTGGGGTGGDSVRYLGLVMVDEYTEDNEVEAGAVFFSYESGIDANLFAAIYSPPLDVCEVDVESTDLNGLDFEPPEIGSTVGFEMVSAGDVLTLMSGAGSYLDLVKKSYSDLTFYTPQPSYVDGPMPTQLTLNIPGDQFPQFANVGMPAVQSFVMSTLDVYTLVLPSTRFAWTAGSNPNAFVEISVSSLNSNSTMTTVDCIVRDDGAFSFPAQTQAEMGENFVDFGVEASRHVITRQQQGDAILLLIASSSNDS